MFQHLFIKYPDVNVVAFISNLGPICNPKMLKVGPKVLHWILSLSISYPYSIKISWFCRQRPRGDEASIKWGVQLGPNRAWLLRITQLLHESSTDNWDLLTPEMPHTCTKLLELASVRDVEKSLSSRSMFASLNCSTPQVLNLILL
jgi:hypothetical protein